MNLPHRAATLRRAPHLSAPALARVLGVDPDDYQQWEDGNPALPLTPWQLADALQVSDHTILDHPSTARHLAALWTSWGPGGGARVAALSFISDWARTDDRLTFAAAPADPALPDCVASRGVPEAGPSIFAAHHLPDLPPAPIGDLTFDQVRAAGSSIAAAAARTWNQSAGPTFDPWEVANRHGIPVGTAPLGDEAFSVTVNVGGAHGHTILVNSSLGHTWRRTALTHALVHVGLGHAPIANCAPIPHRTDRPSPCSGVAGMLCTVTEWVTHWLLDPAAAAQVGPPRTPDPGPVRATGEQPGKWEAHAVRVPPVLLYRELGLAHPALLEEGAGEVTWPPALARRWVAVAARQSGNVGDVRSFPFNTPGCPSPADVEVAIRRGLVVREQLSAQNAAQLQDMYTELSSGSGPDSRPHP